MNPRTLSRQGVTALLILTLTFWVHAGDPFLWVVEGGESKVYLFGSIHFAPPNLYPLDPRVDRAFNESEKLAVEVDIGANQIEGARIMKEKGQYPAGDSLDHHVADSTMKLAEEALQKWAIPIETFKPFRPWYVAMNLQVLKIQSLGYRPESGVDQYFLRKARDRKPIISLETLEDQASIFDVFSPEEEEAYLVSTIQDLDHTEQMFLSLFDAWKQSDVKTLEKLILDPMRNEPQFRAFYQKMFEDRNQVMREKIESFLENREEVFVVVGAGHLIGEKGLLQTLGVKYRVRPISEVEPETSVTPDAQAEPAVP